MTRKMLPCKGCEDGGEMTGNTDLPAFWLCCGNAAVDGRDSCMEETRDLC